MSLDALIAPLVVVDVHEKMTANYKISDDDIIFFENKYGQIPENSFTAFYTGWSQYWHNPNQYQWQMFWLQEMLQGSGLTEAPVRIVSPF